MHRIRSHYHVFVSVCVCACVSERESEGESGICLDVCVRSVALTIAESIVCTRRLQR
jgi:hypothetical protein